MIIKSQNGKIVMPGTKFWTIYDATRHVHHVFVDGALFADYSTERQANEVIADIYKRLVKGETCYEMPLNHELKDGEVEVIVDETSQS